MLVNVRKAMSWPQIYQYGHSDCLRRADLRRRKGSPQSIEGTTAVTHEMVTEDQSSMKRHISEGCLIEKLGDERDELNC